MKYREVKPRSSGKRGNTLLTRGKPREKVGKYYVIRVSKTQEEVFAVFKTAREAEAYAREEAQADPWHGWFVTEAAAWDKP